MTEEVVAAEADVISIFAEAGEEPQSGVKVRGKVNGKVNGSGRGRPLYKWE